MEKTLNITLTGKQAEAYEKGEQIELINEPKYLSCTELDRHEPIGSTNVELYNRSRVYLDLLRVAEHYNNHVNWKPNWEDKEQAKWYVIYDYNQKLFHFNRCLSCDEGAIYFATEDLANLALESNYELFVKYFNIQKQ